MNDNDCSTTNGDGDGDGDDDSSWYVQAGIVHARILNRKKSERPLSSFYWWYNLLMQTVFVNFWVEEAYKTVSRGWGGGNRGRMRGDVYGR